MGIQVEFNPDLALRNISSYQEGKRREEECIPEHLEVGQIYPFLKEGQRNYWFGGEIPLLQTEGNQVLSRPKASVAILEAIHFREGGKVYTRGRYEVKEIFADDRIHFEGFNKL